jgi:hypothetical protein
MANASSPSLPGQVGIQSREAECSSSLFFPKSNLKI